MFTPNNLPKPKAVNVKRAGGFTTQSAGFATKANGRARMFGSTSPKAIRVTPNKSTMGTKPKRFPVETTVLTGAELAARRAAMGK